MTSPWESSTGAAIRQGDLLVGCPVPLFGAEYATIGLEASGEVGVAPADVLVVTQSCDLEVRDGKPPKARLVVVRAVHHMARWIELNPRFKDPKPKEQARRGEMPAIHLVSAPHAPLDNSQALAACVHDMYSLPHQFISAHAAGADERWRLRSPYLEHVSQALARFFMRVGLPSDIPRYC